MKRIYTQIRDIDEIENFLLSAPSGVLCIHLSNEKLMQIACNFVYLDKNIHAYLDSTDENIEYVKYGSLASFTVSSNEIITSKKSEFTYRLSYVTVNGELRDIDDPKLLEQVCELYKEKYSASKKDLEYKVSENLKPVILDTREIKALIEEGF